MFFFIILTNLYLHLFLVIIAILILFFLEVKCFLNVFFPNLEIAVLNFHESFGFFFII